MLRRFICFLIINSFVFSLIIPPQKGFAQGVLGLPEPGEMVYLSPAYEPVLIKGLKINPDNPLNLDFIVATGNSQLTDNDPRLKTESEKLIKYFFAALTLPEKDVWVNLSPYEKNRIVPQATGETEMGRDMLAQDYVLKQITASLIYPEKGLGKDFWDRIYKESYQRFHTTNIPVNTFNKVWIVADKASVYESKNTVMVVDAHLKVMLEEDYLAMSKHQRQLTHSLASQIISSIVLPALEKEVNQGRNFANLRQIFHSLILAKWYKETLKTALLNQVYSNKNKISGVDVEDKTIKEEIYRQYLKAYKKGVFNYIKEDIDQTSKEQMPKKYFSGGLQLFSPGSRLKEATSGQADRTIAAEPGIYVDADSMAVIGDKEAILKAINDGKALQNSKNVFNSMVEDRAMPVMPNFPFNKLSQEQFLLAVPKMAVLIVRRANESNFEPLSDLNTEEKRSKVLNEMIKLRLLVKLGAVMPQIDIVIPLEGSEVMAGQSRSEAALQKTVNAVAQYLKLITVGTFDGQGKKLVELKLALKDSESGMAASPAMRATDALIAGASLIGIGVTTAMVGNYLSRLNSLDPFYTKVTFTVLAVALTLRGLYVIFNKAVSDRLSVEEEVKLEEAARAAAKEQRKIEAEKRKQRMQDEIERKRKETEQIKSFEWSIRAYVSAHEGKEHAPEKIFEQLVDQAKILFFLLDGTGQEGEVQIKAILLQTLNEQDKPEYYDSLAKKIEDMLLDNQEEKEGSSFDVNDLENESAFVKFKDAIEVYIENRKKEAQGEEARIAFQYLVEKALELNDNWRWFPFRKNKVTIQREVSDVLNKVLIEKRQLGLRNVIEKAIQTALDSVNDSPAVKLFKDAIKEYIDLHQNDAMDENQATKDAKIRLVRKALELNSNRLVRYISYIKRIKTIRAEVKEVLIRFLRDNDKLGLYQPIYSAIQSTLDNETNALSVRPNSAMTAKESSKEIIVNALSETNRMNKVSAARIILDYHSDFKDKDGAIDLAKEIIIDTVSSGRIYPKIYPQFYDALDCLLHHSEIPEFQALADRGLKKLKQFEVGPMDAIYRPPERFIQLDVDRLERNLAEAKKPFSNLITGFDYIVASQILTYTVGDTEKTRAARELINNYLNDHYIEDGGTVLGSLLLLWNLRKVILEKWKEWDIAGLGMTEDEWAQALARKLVVGSEGKATKDVTRQLQSAILVMENQSFFDTAMATVTKPKPARRGARFHFSNLKNQSLPGTKINGRIREGIDDKAKTPIIFMTFTKEGLVKEDQRYELVRNRKILTVFGEKLDPKGVSLYKGNSIILKFHRDIKKPQLTAAAIMRWDEEQEKLLLTPSLEPGISVSYIIEKSSKAMMTVSPAIISKKVPIYVRSVSKAIRGGIDFDSSKFTIQKTGSGIEVKFNPAIIAQFKRGNFKGIYPMVTSITPIADIYPLVGLKEPEGS